MKTILLTCLVFLTACTNTPTIITFNDQSVGTFNPTAGCHSLLLTQDCSKITGATKKIKIDEIRLRIAGSTDGRNLLIMSNTTLSPDTIALKNGKTAVDNFFTRKDIEIVNTKVIYGNNIILGHYYTFDIDGYTLLKQLAVK